MYDYLIVGAGLFGAVFAREAADAGKKVLVIDKRSHIGGNIYTENVDGINVHKYGAHIFHTDDKACWEFVNKFAEFNRYTNSPVALIDGKLFNLPFNMNTFHAIWHDVITPEQAQKRIAEQAAEMNGKTFAEIMDAWESTGQYTGIDSIVDWRSDTTSMFKQSNYTEDDAAVNAQYEAATAEIQAQDKVLEAEIKRIETEHKAVETEMESVKKVIDKNIENSYKSFAQ